VRARERNLFLALSVLAAILIWYVVVAAQNPDVERTFTIDLRVRGLPADLQVVQAPARVEARVRGPRSGVTAAVPESFNAHVTVTAAEAGQYRLPVRVDGPPDLRVVSTRPEDALLVLDDVAQRPLSVEVVLQGAPTSGLIPGVPDVRPAAVTIQGPRSIVNAARRAVAEIDVGGLRANRAVRVRVRVLGPSGEPLTGLTVQPAQVAVTVPVNEGFVARTFPVIPTVIGEPDEGLRLALVAVEPPLASVNGPRETVSQLTSIPTEPVSLRGIDGESQRRVRLRLPERVTADAGPFVTLRLVVIASPVERTFQGVPVRVEGVPEGATVTIEPSSVTLRVVGTREAVDRLRPSDIAVAVRAPEGRAGVARVATDVKLPAGVYLAAVAPRDVEIQFKRR
jgi:YbbR domain-containing protein